MCKMNLNNIFFIRSEDFKIACTIYCSFRELDIKKTGDVMEKLCILENWY